MQGIESFITNIKERKEKLIGKLENLISALLEYESVKLDDDTTKEKLTYFIKSSDLVLTEIVNDFHDLKSDKRRIDGELKGVKTDKKIEGRKVAENIISFVKEFDDDSLEIQKKLSNAEGFIRVIKKELGLFDFDNELIAELVENKMNVLSDKVMAPKFMEIKTQLAKELIDEIKNVLPQSQDQEIKRLKLEVDKLQDSIRKLLYSLKLKRVVTD